MFPNPHTVLNPAVSANPASNSSPTAYRALARSSREISGPVIGRQERNTLWRGENVHFSLGKQNVVGFPAIDRAPAEGRDDEAKEDRGAEH